MTTTPWRWCASNGIKCRVNCARLNRREILLVQSTFIVRRTSVGFRLGRIGHGARVYQTDLQTIRASSSNGTPALHIYSPVTNQLTHRICKVISTVWTEVLESPESGDALARNYEKPARREGSVPGWLKKEIEPK